MGCGPTFSREEANGWLVVNEDRHRLPSAGFWIKPRARAGVQEERGPSGGISWLGFEGKASFNNSIASPGGLGG